MKQEENNFTLVDIRVDLDYDFTSEIEELSVMDDMSSRCGDISYDDNDTSSSHAIKLAQEYNNSN